MSVATRVGTGLLLLYMVTTAQAEFGNHKAQGPWGMVREIKAKKQMGCSTAALRALRSARN